MKKVIVLLLLPLCFHVKAQNADENNDVKKGFQKDKLFTGGSLNLGLGSGSTQLGIAPQFGYSLTSWADVGVNFGLNYISQRDYYNYGDKLRQTTYGPGAFVRLFPINFLFATAQYEYNFIHLKYIPVPGSGSPSQVNNVSAASLLVGGGYAGGRQGGGNSYYFISIMWDILGNKNSPYVDGLGRSFPVIRAGYNIGLFQGRYRKTNDSFYNKPDDNYNNR
jgi:hypothetical protein